jgi:hypothetical protein
MNKLLATTAVALLLGGPVLAQQTSTSDATSTAQQKQGEVQTQNQSNGANTNGPQTTTVGPQTSTSNSDSKANSGSLSNANNGGQQTTVAPVSTSANDTSNSNARSNAETTSISVAKGGTGGSATGGAGGSSTSTSGGGSATSNAAGGNATGGNSAATANPNANNAGNAQNITFNSPATPTHTSADIKSAPTVYAPALATTLTETCMGSSSAAGSGMGWGLSFGSTWEDKACERRLNADRVAGLFGDREAARAIMCGDRTVYEAFERVGRPCPGSPNYHPEQKEFYPASPADVPPPPPPPPPPQAAPPPPPETMAPIPNNYEAPRTPRN